MQKMKYGSNEISLYGKDNGHTNITTPWHSMVPTLLYLSTITANTLL